MMGGEIRVESQFGRGSTFSTLRLRFGGPTPNLSHSLRLPFSRSACAIPCRFLIVDDNFTNRRVLGGMLTRWGMKAEPPSKVGDPLLQGFWKFAGGRGVVISPLVPFGWADAGKWDGFSVRQTNKRKIPAVGPMWPS